MITSSIIKGMFENITLAIQHNDLNYILDNLVDKLLNLPTLT